MQMGFVMLGHMRAKAGYQASLMHYCAGQVHSFQGDVRDSQCVHATRSSSADHARYRPSGAVLVIAFLHARAMQGCRLLCRFVGLKIYMQQEDVCKS